MRGFSITQQIAITYSIVAVVSNPPTLPQKPSSQNHTKQYKAFGFGSVLQYHLALSMAQERTRFHINPAKSTIKHKVQIADMCCL